MENEKDVNLDEKKEENVNLDDENKEEKGKNADEEEKELDPYEEYLKKLEEQLEQAKAEKEKAEMIAQQKTGAINEERKKRKELEEKLNSKKEDTEKKYLTAEELDAMLEAREAKRAQLSKVNELTDNEKERQLILKIMEVKGVSADDAYVLANAHLIKEAKQKDEFDEEAFVANFSAGGSFTASNKVVSPLVKAASEGLTEEEKKHLKF